MLLDTLDNRLIFTGELICHTAARIGSGRSNEPVGTDLPVIKDAPGKPFIPGSSLKGVLRTYVESVVRAVYPANRKAVCLPVGPDAGWCLSPSEVESLRDQDQAIYDQSCWVCQAFGSPWFSSKIQVRDALVTAMSFTQYQVRDGVAIDRDTQTAADGFKYDYEVVPAQTRFTVSILAENLTDAQIGMLCVGLRPFERREIGIGGHRSRGLGVVELHWQERKRFAVEGDLDRLFGFIEGRDDVWTPLGDDLIRNTYLPAFRDALANAPEGGGPGDGGPGDGGPEDGGPEDGGKDDA